MNMDIRTRPEVIQDLHDRAQELDRLAREYDSCRLEVMADNLRADIANLEASDDS